MHDTALQPASPLCVAAFSDAGVMVLSSSMRILHINGQAQELMGLFGEAHGFLPHLSPESMPAILTEFCGKILAELDRGGDHRNWTEFETCRVCHMVTPALLLRGFGIPAEDGREHRMILTLQPCLHGGAGYVVEHPLHRHSLRAQEAILTFGTADEWLDDLAGRLRLG